MIKILFKGRIIEASDNTSAVGVTQSGQVYTIANGDRADHKDLGTIPSTAFDTITPVDDLQKIVDYRGINMIVPGWVKYIVTDGSGTIEGYPTEPRPGRICEIWFAESGTENQAVLLSDASVFWYDSMERV